MPFANSRLYKSIEQGWLGDDVADVVIMSERLMSFSTKNAFSLHDNDVSDVTSQAILPAR